MPQSVIRIAAGILAATLFSIAHAQDRFPSRPIRIVVGYSAGGANDIFARLVSTKMSERLGQPVIVENRPGAEAAIAAELVARAPADGYTLFSAASGSMTVAPHPSWFAVSYRTVTPFRIMRWLALRPA